MTKRITIILFLISFTFNYAQNAVIKGKLIAEFPEETEQIAKRAKVILEIRGKKRIAKLDKELNFSFYNVESDTVLIRTKPKSYGVSRTITGFIKPNDTINVNIPYALTCKYDKSKKNKICPTCKKKDEVIPIRYGLIIDISEKGVEKHIKEYKSGGCVITDCNPNWFCKRDETQF